MKKLEDLNDVLTVKEVREFLGISRGKAYELVNEGEFRVVRVGSKILIPKKAFVDWIEGN